MANQNKTKPTKISVSAYIQTLDTPEQKKDVKTIIQLWKEITPYKPKIWGESIIGFGEYHYKYKSGREGDFFLVGASARKQSLTIYAMNGWEEYKALLKKLGPHKLGSSCLYIKKIEAIHLPTLKQLMKKAYKDTYAYIKKEHTLQ